MMGLGVWLHELVSPAMEAIAPYLPGDVFPFFFTLDMFQRVLVASFVITVIAGVLGSFLLIRNMALIGDGIAHVTFGGVAVSMVLAGVPTLPMATFFAVVAAVLIFELQDRGLLEGDTAIAIMMTGALAFGLVALRMWGEGITANVERFLYGNVLFVDDASLDWICTVGLVALLLLGAMYKGLLAAAVDPVAARVQGIPVRAIGLTFSIVTAVVVVLMVKIIGALLVTALLVSPAATAQQVGKSFRSCVLWSQFFGLMSVLIGIYLSAEEDTGAGAMIALVAAVIFLVVVVSKSIAVRLGPAVNQRTQ
ncbi:MAG: metal ABC transporter permease [Candidatus Poseidonia sp.]|jgi:ABC-type Mn2+/Zn2+ transport system permease subunit|nr:metal ABC transporter permease [Poseidonia sp.]